MKTVHVLGLCLLSCLALTEVACQSSGYRDDRPLADPSLFGLQPSDPAASIQIRLSDLPQNLGTALKTKDARVEASFVSLDGSPFRLLSYREAASVQVLDERGKILSEASSFSRLLPSKLARSSARGSDGRFEFLSFLDFLAPPDLETVSRGEARADDPAAARLRAVTSSCFVFADAAGKIVPIQILSERTEAALPASAE